MLYQMGVSVLMLYQMVPCAKTLPPYWLDSYCKGSQLTLNPYQDSYFGVHKLTTSLSTSPPIYKHSVEAVTGSTGWPIEAAFSEDGKVLFFVHSGWIGYLYSKTFPDGITIHALGGNNGGHSPTCTAALPDAHFAKQGPAFVTGGKDHHLILWNLFGKNPKAIQKSHVPSPLTSIHTSKLNSVSSSLHFPRVYSAAHDKRLGALDYTVNKVVWQSKLDFAASHIVSNPVHPNLLLISKLSTTEQLAIIDDRENTGLVARKFHFSPGQGSAQSKIKPSWSPCGNMFSCGSPVSGFKVWDVRGNPDGIESPNLQHATNQAVWSPQKNALISIGHNNRLAAISLTYY